MDDLSLDPDVLETTASIIEGYCSRQTDIMDSYLSDTTSLSSEWSDDQTLGKLLEEIKILRGNVVNVMNEIRGAYPSFFRKKAEQIRSRPKF